MGKHLFKFLVFIFIFIFDALIFSDAYAQTEWQCNFEWRVCKADDPGNDPLYYAEQCYNPSASCNDRALSKQTASQKVCNEKYNSCIYNKCGSFSDKNIISCARRCLKEADACDEASVAIPQPAYTPPPTTTMPSYPIDGGNVSSNGSNANSAVIYDSPESSDNSEETNLAIECAKKGGTVLDGSCSLQQSTEEDNQKDLGNDLETLKRVSEIGAQSAQACATLKKDALGALIVDNTCSQRVNFGYCYSEWVSKRATATNPFKCDGIGKPHWGQATHVNANQVWKAHLQNDAKSMRLNFGPCIGQVEYNGRTYGFIHSKRTASGSANGRGGKYKCTYFKKAE